MEEFRLPRSFGQVESSEGGGQGETAGTGAAGIDKEDPVAGVALGLVGMAMDDDVEA